MANYLTLTDDYTKDQIEDVFGDLVHAVTGLPRELIHPLWQPEMPQQPDIDTDWCAFGIENENAVYTPISVADSQQSIAMSIITFFDMYIVFYGKNGLKLCSRLRDSLFIATNREPLGGMCVKIKNPSAIKRIPELINNKWYDRYDMRVHMVRSIRRTTKQTTIESGNITIRHS